MILQELWCVPVTQILQQFSYSPVPNNSGGGRSFFIFPFFCQSYPLIKPLPTCWFSHSVSTPQFIVHTLNFPSVYTPMFVPQFSRNSYFLLYLNIASKDILTVKKVLFKSAFLQKYLQWKQYWNHFYYIKTLDLQVMYLSVTSVTMNWILLPEIKLKISGFVKDFVLLQYIFLMGSTSLTLTNCFSPTKFHFLHLSNQSFN